ncbi:putative flavin carrier protein [Meyerozyma sp. JA9]|nr:putative flavin carrier protein [Meyerozyma sp. JA9]
MRVFFFLSLMIQLMVASAKRSLSATSLVTCMQNSQISPTFFNVTFNPDDRSIRYTLDLTTEINTYVTAHVQVYAYGFLIIEQDVDLCNLGWKQFCPLYPGSLQVDSIEYISQKYVDMIPGIAYQVPDIDAVVRVDVKDRDTKQTVSCIQSNFTNGKTVSQTGAKWATAIIAGLGLVIAAVFSTFGSSNAASHISTNAVTLFSYFQAVVIVSMQHVERVPPIASAWAENLAWSMGLIRVEFMQKIFRWYIQSSGGSPTLYFKKTTKQILVQRAYDYLQGLHEFAKRNSEFYRTGKRALDFTLRSNDNLAVLRGIKRIGYNSRIEPTSIVVTGFTFFVLFGYVLVVVLFVIKQVIELLVRFNKINPNRFHFFRKSFKNILKGSLVRYMYIGFPQLIILSLWEFTENDSPAVIVLAVLFLIMALVIVGYSFWTAWRYGRLSIAKYNNPAALLYGDSHILNKYGVCYTMFTAKKYWFGGIVIGYAFVKGIFIALCQASGKTSALVIFILDLAFTIYLFLQAPYLDKSTNIVNYCVAIVNTINSFLFLFFSDLFGQPAQVASIMGWVFFVLNAGFSLVLLVMIIVLIIMSIVSKNPDAVFAPARDDRTSFQRKSSVKRTKDMEGGEKGGNELLALGAAAQDHSNDWEAQMYQLNNYSQGSGSPTEEKQILTPSLKEGEHEFTRGRENSDENVHAENKTLGERLKTKLSRGLSRKGSKKADTANITRMSDTLSMEDSGNIKDEVSDSFNSSATLSRGAADKSGRHIRHPTEASFGQFSNYSNSQPTAPKDITR